MTIMYSMNSKMIKFYGAGWCADCRKSKQFIDEKGIGYTYIDIENVPGAAKKVEKINNGFQSIPTIVFPNGKVLIEPSNVELEKALQ